MRMTIAKGTNSIRTVLGFMRRWPQGETVMVIAQGAEVNRRDTARPDLGRPMAQEPEVVTARGKIRRQEVPLLTHYGTSYGLFDEWIADYGCVLKSDAYRLGDYVGDSVWVSGPLTGVIGGMPVMNVTHLELLKLKWMR
jgi:hypothetical protein